MSKGIMGSLDNSIFPRLSIEIYAEDGKLYNSILGN